MKIKLKRRKGTNKKQNNQKLRKFGERLNIFFSDKKNIAVTSLFVIIIVIASVCGVVGWKKVNRPKNKEVLTTEALSEAEKMTTTQAETETETETETEANLEEEIDYDTFDELMEEEVPDEEQEAWQLPPRTMTSENIPYDGQYREISCWGDSMTRGWGSDDRQECLFNGRSYTYPMVLEMLTHIPTYNYGFPGATSDEIAMIQGGIPLYTENDIFFTEGKESELNIVRSDNGQHVFMDDYLGMGADGRVYMMDRLYDVRYDNGKQYCSLAYYMALTTQKNESGIITVAETAGAQDNNTSATQPETKNDSVTNPTQPEQPTQPAVKTYTIPAGTRVYPKEGYDHRDDILILEIGSNGGWENDYKTLILQYDAMIQSADCKYYIIVGDTDDPGTSIGDLNQGETDDDGNYIGIGDTSWEAALRLAYGDHFINMRTYLIQNGLKDTGLVPTRDDLENYKIGRISKRLRCDWTHLNSKGYYSKGRGIYLKGVELGYWS